MSRGKRSPSSSHPRPKASEARSKLSWFFRWSTRKVMVMVGRGGCLDWPSRSSRLRGMDLGVGYSLRLQSWPNKSKLLKCGYWTGIRRQESSRKIRLRSSLRVIWRSLLTRRRSCHRCIKVSVDISTSLTMSRGLRLGATSTRARFSWSWRRNSSSLRTATRLSQSYTSWLTTCAIT